MESSSANRRVARNTVINYIQMFVTMVVGLLSSRYVLKALGVDDFGLYGVVGGLLAMFMFISGSLSSATTRFINFEMGKPNGDLNRIFNICLVIHVVIALVIFFLAESIGVLYIHRFLNVPTGKEGDAMFVFQVSTIVSCIGVINVPYQGLFNAFEKFGHIAVINIINSIVKLGLVIMLLSLSGNRLSIYAVMMCANTLVGFVAYHALSYRYWPDVVKHKFVRHDSAYREIFAFNNYNLLYSGSLMARGSGSNLLINYFFGTSVNASFGIASTVQTYLSSLITNIDSAAGPQITQSYSSGNKERYTTLVNKLNRYSILAALAAGLTLLVEIDGILDLWLAEVPDLAVLFCQVIIVMTIVASTSTGLPLLINASGRVKEFRLISSAMFLLTIPVGFVLYKVGMPSYGILVLFTVVDVNWRIIQLILMKKILDYDVKGLLKSVYPRVLVVVTIFAVYFVLYEAINPVSWLSRTVGFFLTGLFSLAVTYFVGLLKEEKQLLISFIKVKFGAKS